MIFVSANPAISPFRGFSSSSLTLFSLGFLSSYVILSQMILRVTREVVLLGQPLCLVPGPPVLCLHPHLLPSREQPAPQNSPIEPPELGCLRCLTTFEAQSHP